MVTNNIINTTKPFPVSTGGTGVASTTAYGVLAGGTTGTGPLQNVGVGTSGYVLTSNGAGALSTWQALGTNKAVLNEQIFTTSGTYTPTSGMVYCIVECCGGGGGSGGLPSTDSSHAAVSGNAGAGGYSRKILSASTVGASQTITIGAGGTGGASGSNPGSAGGTTSFGSIFSASGGNGGTAGASLTSADVVVAAGGTGGTGSGGDFNVTGGTGGDAIAVGLAPTCQSPSGGSFFGSGIIRSHIDGSPQTPQTYGVGASGGSSSINDDATAGANGAPGVVIVTEFIAG